ncbi:hypothetical protein M8Z33_31605 [Streptomyces sp. ZAF1911]|nr:hypothetical protein [Streptomyces sp. ZAF1911]MDD9381116.1 hypothetical protein [Streptomyces sp. ZAF1911]
MHPAAQPAAGAGIVVVEQRAGDEDAAALLSPLTHRATRVVLDAERAVLSSLEGGCLPAASAHAVLDPVTQKVTGQAAVLDPSGGPAPRTASSGPADRAAEVGRDAGLPLLHAGAARLLAVSPH